ncbi:MAG: hypothetical protein J3Q66DRAFT_438185 [Benniella sp.]|nr:MAG: hypothetical protein J3Q66DRAFT_438185 [Benniella sp.]
MDGVDCDWCLVCDKRTSAGATYCSSDCRSSDLISSSVSSSSSSSTSTFSMTDPQGIPLLGTSSSAISLTADTYSMPPFVRKQRTILGGAASSSTEEAMALLSRPGSQRSRNYHGIVHFDRHYQMRQEITVASEDQPENYLPKDQIPDVNHPQVKAWVAEIDWSKVPNISVAEPVVHQTN